MPITDDSAAFVEFSRLCNPDECPELSDDDVQDILDAHKRASLWVANTTYQIGAVIIPTLANRNGRRFKAVAFNSGQQSGATEPTWTTGQDSRVTDNQVVWQEDGWDYDAVLWDFKAAAHEGWERKASSAVKATDVADSQGITGKWSQIYDHCKKQSASYQVSRVL